ncbi:MAG: hypothetical protein HY361_01590 [Candidatus Aenigmarchaeota archaeon]|nr:hypothetical protein [Candidatus Aenigmarchaeota archaeon]
MKDVKDKLMGTVYPASLRSRAKLVIIGTLFADNDIYQWIAEHSRSGQVSGWMYRRTWVEMDEIEKKVYICVDTDEEGILRKEDTDKIYEYEELWQMKVSDPDKFSREFMCVVITSESSAYRYDDCVANYLEGETFHDTEREGCRYVAGVDFARSPGDKGDFTVVILLELKTDGTKIIRNMLRLESKVHANEQVEAIAEFLKRYGLVYTLCERNNMGMSIIDFLQQNHGLWIEHEYTDHPRRNDMLMFIEHQLKSGKIKFPRGDDVCRNKTDIIIDELIRMKHAETAKGLKTYRSTGLHDDCTISLAYACKSTILNRHKPSQIEVVSAPSKILRIDESVEYMYPGRQKVEDKGVLTL